MSFSRTERAVDSKSKMAACKGDHFITHSRNILKWETLNIVAKYQHILLIFVYLIVYVTKHRRLIKCFIVYLLCTYYVLSYFQDSANQS